ncbi:PLC-like phosphodiesterase [Sporormia fimetaria CBS 119925]|uniref:PLC-like phosphodiesterase n=1 Tax=Sporormia fimetaria CBS 119925 TaxID=1340428 RepID=A0A6A6UW85_9PLEO|nr:PLC-like phosphodiesterase [Sporormia fimetaria CBS 119925]
MRSTLLFFVALATAQIEESSQEVRTLTGSERRITTDSARPTVTLPDLDLSTMVSELDSWLAENSASTNSTTTTTVSEPPLTEIIGTKETSTTNQTSSTTTDAPEPTNTQPCNNYVEFCTRRYSNITEVCAHNSPFVRKNNIAANQHLDVTQQLNDGIRMLQGQVHDVNGTLHYCHSSCDLLDAGPVEDYLRKVVAWLEDHPYEVLTIIFGNAEYERKNAFGDALVTSVNFIEPIQNSGLKRFIYQPPKPRMTLSDWPTLGELILSQKRVITFIDYNFNTNAVPYLLWEFYNIWETPFSPTNFEFPCTLGRPDGIGREQQDDMMYIANHNLNVEVAIAEWNLLVPNLVSLNTTNGIEGRGSLGEMVNTCTGIYNRPPNFLLVDFYNEGPFNGSVFEVAAQANNVTYNRKCCGRESRAAYGLRPSAGWPVGAIAMVIALSW